MDMGIELSPLCGMVICIVIAAFFALWGAGLLIVRLRQRRKRSPQSASARLRAISAIMAQ